MSDKLKARMQGHRSPRVIVGRLTTNLFYQSIKWHEAMTFRARDANNNWSVVAIKNFSKIRDQVVCRKANTRAALWRLW